VAISVVLADDHQLVREGFRALLERDRFNVLGEAEDGRAAVQLVRTFQPDVAVLDLGMPLLNGVDAARQIASLHLATKTLLLTIHVEPQYVMEAFRAGIRGYVLKAQTARDLCQAIRDVFRGGVYLSPSAADTVIQHSLARNASLEVLTLRELEVLRLIAEGKSTKEVANLLGVSVKTADCHRTKLMAKLEIHETASLVRYAIRHGLIQP
jgi:two-component system response regulator NreC